MKAFLFLCLAVICSLASASFAQVIPGAAPHQTDISQTPQSSSAFMASKLAAGFSDGAYVATTKTFNDLAVFSYFDHSSFSIFAADGSLVDSFTLDRGKYYATTTGNGVFHIESNHPFTLLAGDPFTNPVIGYFAVGEGGRPLSTRILTYVPALKWGGELFIVFGYKDNTEFVIKDLDTGEVIASGILNRGEHFELEGLSDVFLGVKASKPVSTLTYADMGYYIPATNGTFAGKQFYGYAGFTGYWPNGIIVTSYEDGTEYQVINSDSEVEIASGILAEGEATQIVILEPTYFTVKTNKNATVSNTPFAGYKTAFFYMVRHIDELGTGMGTHFYAPTPVGDLDVFSHGDNNHIQIYDMWADSLVWDDTLAIGEDIHLYTDNRTVFKLTGSEDISVYSSFGALFAADFVPLSYARGMPDLAISAADLNFVIDDSTGSPGEPMTISATVFNYGWETAENVTVQFYDGEPQGNQPISAEILVDQIAAGDSAIVSIDWTVPESPEYHTVYAAVDLADQIQEANNSNNTAFRFVIANDDFQPPMSTFIENLAESEFKTDSETDSQVDIAVAVYNGSDSLLQNPSFTIHLPDELSLTDESDSTVTLADLPAAEAVTQTWTVNIDAPSATGNTYFYSVTVAAENAEPKILERMLVADSPVTIQQQPTVNLPTSIYLEQNYPNPFNPTTSISYTLAESGTVDLMIFNMLGEHVRTLVSEDQGIGTYNVTWDASSDTGESVASGTYVYRLRLGDAVMVRKMLLLR